jgi:hypothetical protein
LLSSKRKNNYANKLSTWMLFGYKFAWIKIYLDACDVMITVTTSSLDAIST